LGQIHHQLKSWDNVPTSYLAPGLHPFYFEEHQPEHLTHLEHILRQQDCEPVGEIGLHTFLKEHKQPDIYEK
ncbi:TatD family hydrolase, partial [Acinetobacter calcoaceticus]|uniref:TatD family hydrolase n=1 Tax=Acinetobacter calcoaceticus TaxID=471 RepID=UPI003F7C5A5D